MHSVQFYYCEHCENLVEMVHSSGVNLVCCGQDMTELTPNTSYKLTFRFESDAEHLAYLDGRCFTVKDAWFLEKLGFSMPKEL